VQPAAGPRSLVGHRRGTLPTERPWRPSWALHDGRSRARPRNLGLLRAL
jgi:hypothetical protein